MTACKDFWGSDYPVKSPCLTEPFALPDPLAVQSTAYATPPQVARRKRKTHQRPRRLRFETIPSAEFFRLVGLL